MTRTAQVDLVDLESGGVDGPGRRTCASRSPRPPSRSGWGDAASVGVTAGGGGRWARDSWQGRPLGAWQVAGAASEGVTGGGGGQCGRDRWLKATIEEWLG